MLTKMINFPQHPIKYFTSNPKEIHKTYHKILQEESFPDVVQFGFNSKIVTCPKKVRTVLKYLPKSNMIYDDLSYPVEKGRFLGEGILTTDRLNASLQRKEFDKQFMKKLLNVFEEFMKRETISEIEKLDEAEVVNVKDMCRSIAMNVVGKSLFGNIIDDDMKDDITDHVQYINQEVINNLLPGYGLVKYVPSYTRYMIDKTKKVRDTLKYALHMRKTSAVKCDDLLDVIINTNDDDEIVVDNMLTFFLAGYDTSATALAFCLQVIHQDHNKHHLKQLLDEINNTDNIDDMNYLDCVIKETLRLYPPATSVLRKYDEQFSEHFTDVNVNVNGQVDWKSNMEIIVPIYSIHRNPKYWSRPNDFIPERWYVLKDTDISDIYIPFSFGSRNCIGKHFALREMKIVLYTILKNITFTNMTDKIDTIVIPVLNNKYEVTANIEKN